VDRRLSREIAVSAERVEWGGRDEVSDTARELFVDREERVRRQLAGVRLAVQSRERVGAQQRGSQQFVAGGDPRR
jgi:hypothetical protein